MKKNSPKNPLLKLLFSLLAYSYLCTTALAQSDSLHIYFIPGQGADARLFNNIKLDPQYVLHKVQHKIPKKGMNMQEYALMLSEQIDTSQAFVLVGVSLGGMLAGEMLTFMHPEKVIIISSAKSRHEFPAQYSFQRFFPLYKIIPGLVSKWGAQLLQPLVEPDRKHEKETFKSMLKDKSPKFYRRSIAMIIQWKRTSYDDSIIHIHGEEDHTIPIRNVNYDFMIQEGSHMMTLTEGKKLSDLLNKILEN